MKMKTSELNEKQRAILLRAELVAATVNALISSSELLIELGVIHADDVDQWARLRRLIKARAGQHRGELMERLLDSMLPDGATKEWNDQLKAGDDADTLKDIVSVRNADDYMHEMATHMRSRREQEEGENEE